MSQWLRALAEFPSILMGLLASSSGSDILFWPLRARSLVYFTPTRAHILKISKTYTLNLKKNQHRKLVRWLGRHLWNNPENLSSISGTHIVEEET